MIYAAFFFAFTFAHLALCAAPIFALAFANIFRRLRVGLALFPLYAPTKAESAAFNLNNSCSALSRSFFSCLTIFDNCPIGSPSRLGITYHFGFPTNCVDSLAVGDYRSVVKWKTRIPKIGDRVTAVGQNGTFVVYSVDSRLRCAELKLIGHDSALSSIPWGALTFSEPTD